MGRMSQISSDVDARIAHTERGIGDAGSVQVTQKSFECVRGGVPGEEVRVLPVRDPYRDASMSGCQLPSSMVKMELYLVK